MPLETKQALEATASLADLLDRVQQGEQIAITRSGVHVATLVPASADRQARAAAAFVRLRERRRDIDLQGLSLREMIEEGRR